MNNEYVPIFTYVHMYIYIHACLQIVADTYLLVVELIAQLTQIVLRSQGTR